MRELYIREIEKLVLIDTLIPTNISAFLARSVVIRLSPSDILRHYELVLLIVGGGFGLQIGDFSAPSINIMEKEFDSDFFVRRQFLKLTL